jgi:hypothetical protein
MIFSNPSEASIVVKLEAATPAGNERGAALLRGVIRRE